MSRLIEWYTVELLRQMGWPKSKGVFRKQLYADARVVDVAVEEAIRFGVGLGAGRPQLGAAALTDTFLNNPWTEKSTAELVLSLSEGVGEIDRTPGAFPWTALYAKHRLAPYGTLVPWKDMGDEIFVGVRGMVAARGIFWGLTHERDMPGLFAKAKARYEQTAPEMLKAGLGVPAGFPWTSLEHFYETCEGIVRTFESVRPPLPGIATALRQHPKIARRLKT